METPQSESQPELPTRPRRLGYSAPRLPSTQTGTPPPRRERHELNAEEEALLAIYVEQEGQEWVDRHWGLILTQAEELGHLEQPPVR